MSGRPWQSGTVLCGAPVPYLVCSLVCALMTP
jgi:hypothetical protein